MNKNRITIEDVNRLYDSATITSNVFKNKFYELFGHNNIFTYTIIGRFDYGIKINCFVLRNLFEVLYADYKTTIPSGDSDKFGEYVAAAKPDTFDYKEISSEKLDEFFQNHGVDSDSLAQKIIELNNFINQHLIKLFKNK